MHCSFTLAALLVSAVVAKPINRLQQKRAIVYETEYAVVVETVFVTAGQAAPAPSTAVAAAATTPATHAVWQHTAHKHSSSSSTKKSTTTTPKTTTTPPPAPTTTTTTPAPVQPTTSEAPVETTSTEAPATTSTPVSDPSPTGANTYQSVILAHHNAHRANHSAPALTWSDDLTNAALAWAQQCNYEHNTVIGNENIPGGYGQNIAAGAPANQISNVITDMMYNGEMPNYANYYGLDNPDFTNFVSYGHFTQIVWAATTQVGCATVQCNTLENTSGPISPIMTVCNYHPAGNMGGEYGTNVGRPLGGATIYGNDDVSAGYS